MQHVLKPLAMSFFLILFMTGLLHAADVNDTATDSAAVTAPNAAATTSSKPDIPVLNWQQRSDWINVKTDIKPAAIGDGVADDSQAIQAALDSVKTGCVIYFPAGNYRITKPLFMGQKSRNVGVNLVGHGRNTRLFWDGEKGGYMLTINGQSMSRYMGISFDGMNKAARGFYFFNDGKSSFITNLSLKDLAFRNFVEAGIYQETENKKSKNRDLYATAETVYDNCLFENNGSGVLSHWFNDLNHTFTGCEFRDNGIGINFGHGNYYVRDSHFERSKEVDIKSRFAEHSVTVRRVTSSNSAQFLHFSSSVGVLTIENCRVKNWTDPRKAMLLRTGSALLFDNVFEGAPDSQSSVMYEKQRGVRVISNNTMQGSTNILFQGMYRGGQLKYVPGAKPSVWPSGYDAARYYTTYQIPESASKVKPVDIAMDQSFLKTTRTLPDKIFDAKVDFGAVGDNKTDDTDAIQKTIDAARAYGKNCVAYIPTGKYNITKTIHITGENYTIAGTGFGSALIWKGQDGGNLVQVKGPKNIVLDSLSIGQSDHDRGKGKQHRDLIQVGVNEPSSVVYDRVFTYGKYARNDRRGMELSNLGPKETVVIDQIAGNLMIDNSAQATILGNVSYEGTLTIQGDSKKRDGFTGFMTRLATHVEYALVIRNNQSAVFSEFYIEQAPNVFWFEGTPDDPAGRVTIQSPKIDATGQKEQMDKARVFNIEGYTGDIFMAPSKFNVNPREMRFSLRGNAKADLYLIGNMFYQSAPVFLDTTPSIKVHWLGAYMVGPADLEARRALTKDNVRSDQYDKFGVMLDDLRTLGANDIRLNFPNINK